MFSHPHGTVVRVTVQRSNDPCVDPFVEGSSPTVGTVPSDKTF
jgi:hypothetical protein